MLNLSLSIYALIYFNLILAVFLVLFELLLLLHRLSMFRSRPNSIVASLEFRVNENHTLVLQPQELSHKVQITSEFGEETVHLRLFDLDDERLGAVDALS